MQLAEFPFNEDMNSGDPVGIGAFCLTRVLSTSANQTFARLGSALDRRRQEVQCLGLISYTSTLQAELRYLG
jgi:hypothetical protein